MKPILRTRYLILRQCSNLNGQASTFFSSNGCKVDINYLLLFSDLYIFKIYSRAFLSDYKNTVLFLYESFAYKTSYLFFFFIFRQQFGAKASHFQKRLHFGPQMCEMAVYLFLRDLDTI